MYKWREEEYVDDRVFVLDLRLATKGDHKVWTLITRRNVGGVRIRRVDNFERKEDAVAYLKLVEPETPRISLNGQPPQPALTYEEYLAWCKSEGIADAMQVHEMGQDMPKAKLVIQELTPDELVG